MTTIYDVPADSLINAVAMELSKNKKIKPPEWAPFVKTGVHKERRPENSDWWYVRCASSVSYTHLDVYKRQHLHCRRVTAQPGEAQRVRQYHCLPG